jgi:hypothetical protein
MAKAEATVDELVSMIQRGELRLPEMQRRYVWRSTRVRDLMDSLYRGYPSGAILVWDTDEGVPLQEFAVTQTVNPYQSTRLLLDGQQRLTSLSAVIRGERVTVRGRRPSSSAAANRRFGSNTCTFIPAAKRSSGRFQPNGPREG